jgi:hypothetical protein
MIALLPAIGGAQSVDEYEVKAAFLYNFTKFIEWPETQFPGATFSMCIFGDDPFGHAIDNVTRGKTVNGRVIKIRRVSEIVEARECQILFVGSADRRKTQQLLDAASLPPVLTVGDSVEFLRVGGLIGFSMDDSHVGVIINQNAAEARGLKISAKLLSLATIYKKGK